MVSNRRLGPLRPCGQSGDRRTEAGPDSPGWEEHPSWRDRGTPQWPSQDLQGSSGGVPRPGAGRARLRRRRAQARRGRGPGRPERISARPTHRLFQASGASGAGRRPAFAGRQDRPEGASPDDRGAGPGRSRISGSGREIIMKRIAVLDDYQGVVLSLPYWARLGGLASVDAYRDSPADEGALVRRLRPYEIVVPIRERTAFPASLLERLPSLELLALTGRNSGHVALRAAASRRRPSPWSGRPATSSGGSSGRGGSPPHT